MSLTHVVVLATITLTGSAVTPTIAEEQRALDYSGFEQREGPGRFILGDPSVTNCVNTSFIASGSTVDYRYLELAYLE